MPRCLACYEEIDHPGIHESCSKRIFGTTAPPSLESIGQELEKQAQVFLEKKLAITGVQRKLSLHLEHKNSERFTILSAMGGNFILKPPSDEFDELPELEDVSMHLAKIVGLEVAQHCLLPTLDGNLAYVTRRFDRIKGKKIAQEDACQLSEVLTENKYKSSHEKLAKVIKQYSSFPGDDLLRLFELTLFSFLTGNADMHLKNFSLLQNNRGHYRLSPAYDLVPTRLLIPKIEDSEELALNLNGKKSRFKLADFLAYGDNTMIPEKVVDRTLKMFAKKKGAMLEMIELSFLSDKRKNDYRALIEERYNRLGLENR